MHRMLSIVSCLMLASCANLYPPSKSSRLSDGENYWLSYDASRRGALVVSNNSQLKSCSEPSPDVALSFVNSLKGDFKTPGGTSATNVDATANATAIALAGRNEVVLLAREALFRICEASQNGVLSSSDVPVLIKDVFEKVSEIAISQAKDSKNKARIAEAQLRMIQLQK